MSREPRWMTALLDEGERLIMADEKHGLGAVRRFVNGKPSPEGDGWVPIKDPLAQPYWRYYCNCGHVGGKRSTEEASRLGHEIHVREVIHGG